MSYTDVINKVIQELTIPDAQAWVTLEELIKQAEELDDSTERHNNKLDS